MNKEIIIPPVPFYFIRHGETDWNRINNKLCDQDDIPLNENGLYQATNVCSKLDSLGITKIYSSPLVRARQTAEIIRDYLGQVDLEFHPGLGNILDKTITSTFAEILEPSEILLVVSHGEVYRMLLRILHAQFDCHKAQNCGLYFFNPYDAEMDKWVVSRVHEELS